MILSARVPGQGRIIYGKVDRLEIVDNDMIFLRETSLLPMGSLANVIKVIIDMKLFCCNISHVSFHYLAKKLILCIHSPKILSNPPSKSFSYWSALASALTSALAGAKEASNFNKTQYSLCNIQYSLWNLLSPTKTDCLLATGKISRKKLGSNMV